FITFMNANGTAKFTTKLASGMNGMPALRDFDFFGTSISPLGDLDGDGIGDLAVGAGYADNGLIGKGRGAVMLVFLNSNGTVKSLTRIDGDTANGPTLQDADYFGTSVASLGDLDGDGVTDIAVGAFGDGAV